ncbi:MAG: class I adenylate-forming enzyme family protein [Caulobacteraceae bacterium]
MNTSTKKDVRRMPDALKVKAGIIPDHIAHDDTRRVLSVAEWDTEADDVGGGLAAAGLAPGDRVFLPITNQNAVEMAIAVIAVMRAGGIAVPVNTRLADEEFAAYAALIEPRFIITNVADKIADLGVERVWAVENMPRDVAALPDQSKLDPAAEALILGTSGTTGAIKGVVVSHSDLAARLGDGSRVDRHANSTLHALPFTGSGGMLGECLLPIRAGATCYTQPSFDPGGFLELVAAKRPTTVYFVPSMLRLVLDHPDAAKSDFSSVRYVLTGTAPLPQDSVIRALKLWPHVTLRNSYGMSEGGAGASTRTNATVLKAGCVGKMPPHMQIRDKSGNRAPNGVTGEIYGRQQHPRRYWRDEAATRQSWVGGWTRTGDLGYVDAEGDLIISGRSKDLIIRGGYNITPIEIENVLHDHPSVKDAAVIGIAHDILGEDIAAALVLVDGAKATVEEMQSWCRDRLADNKVPRTIVFFDALPLNQNAKVLKRDLKPVLERAAEERRDAARV